MIDSIRKHNDSLMEAGYQILNECKKQNVLGFIWGGGAIYHILGGSLDYRKMSDIEFLLPKSDDKKFQEIVEEMGFIPYTTFNNIQNMYSMPRREYYRPNREVTNAEIEDIKFGRRKDIKDIEFQKLELFLDGIRMCWTFKINDLPKDYLNSSICPPGFQIALKSNPIHPDDFDFKDIQDIASIFNYTKCCINEDDTIFLEPFMEKKDTIKIGKNIFEVLSKTKLQFAGTVIRNLSEVLKYQDLNDEGKSKIKMLLEFLDPLKDQGGLLSNLRKERPVRVEARTR